MSVSVRSGTLDCFFFGGGQNLMPRTGSGVASLLLLSRFLVSHLNNIFRLRFREPHLLRHLHRMLIPQMPIHLHRQRPAVFMPEPTTDGGDIDAGFNAPGCKQVAEIVMCNTGHANDLCVYGKLSINEIMQRS